VDIGERWRSLRIEARDLRERHLTRDLSAEFD